MLRAPEPALVVRSVEAVLDPFLDLLRERVGAALCILRSPAERCSWLSRVVASGWPAVHEELTEVLNKGDKVGIERAVRGFMVENDLLLRPRDVFGVPASEPVRKADLMGPAGATVQAGSLTIRQSGSRPCRATHERAGLFCRES